MDKKSINHLVNARIYDFIWDYIYRYILDSIYGIVQVERTFIWDSVFDPVDNTVHNSIKAEVYEYAVDTITEMNNNG